jgi:hypothetical protein
MKKLILIGPLLLMLGGCADMPMNYGFSSYGPAYGPDMYDGGFGGMGFGGMGFGGMGFGFGGMGFGGMDDGGFGGFGDGGFGGMDDDD